MSTVIIGCVERNNRNAAIFSVFMIQSHNHIIDFSVIFFRSAFCRWKQVDFRTRKIKRHITLFLNSTKCLWIGSRNRTTFEKSINYLILIRVSCHSIRIHSVGSQYTPVYNSWVIFEQADIKRVHKYVALYLLVSCQILILWIF